jgi:hypothetical protein
VTAFRHEWKKLRSATGPPLPIFLVNNVEEFVNGIEAWATYQATPAWRLSGGFTTLGNLV